MSTKSCQKSRKIAEEIKTGKQIQGNKSSKVTQVYRKTICSYQKYFAKPWNSVKLSNTLLQYFFPSNYHIFINMLEYS